MIVINIDKVLREAKEKLTHKPTIRIILPDVIEEAAEVVGAKVSESLEKASKIHESGQSLKDALIYDLDNQERDVRIERAKQSNKYLPMISAGAGQGELAAHYKLIESISSDIRDIYDKREHVRQHGRLPEQGSVQSSIDNSNILALKDQRRSLVNRRSKLKKKIEVGKAKNSPALAEWELKLDQMDAEFKVVSDRIIELKDE